MKTTGPAMSAPETNRAPQPDAYELAVALGVAVIAVANIGG